MNFKRAFVFLVATGWLCPAFAGDAGANFLAKLFIDACVANLGQPAKVRAWAEARHLNQIQDPAPLNVFVGPGGKGSAWAIPAAVGSFALSLRGITEACVVYARQADPETVTPIFKEIIVNVKRPGIEVEVDKDFDTQTPFGKAHLLQYRVHAVGAKLGYIFALTAVEKTGGPFQASIFAAGYKD